MTAAEIALRDGLVKGYAAGVPPKTARRGPFTIKSSYHRLPDIHGEYLDEWMFVRTGGGQEIASSGRFTVTRVFAGGVADPEKLSALKITHDDVIRYFRSKLCEVAGISRMHEQVITPPDGDWQYRYEIRDSFPEIPLTIGEESILYKGSRVFVHIFLITPVA